MKIFSGSSNKELGDELSRVGKWQIGQVEISSFSNGEKRIKVEKATHGETRAIIIQSFDRPVDERIIEFCLLADAVSRAGYTELIGVVPWLGYSKQDKVFVPGEPLSAKVIAQIIQTTKISKLITFDLHNRAITGFFEIPVVELSAKSLFLDYFRNKLSDQSSVISDQGSHDYVVVAPDEGAVKASAYFARELGVPIAYMDKRRDLTTGNVEVVGMSGEVKNKDVVIVDDMIVTGSTIMQSAKYLKRMGAKRVIVAATHYLNVPKVAQELEQSEVDQIIVTNTVGTNPQTLKNKKLKVVSIAGLLVDEIA